MRNCSRCGPAKDKNKAFKGREERLRNHKRDDEKKSRQKKQTDSRKIEEAEERRDVAPRGGFWKRLGTEKATNLAQSISKEKKKSRGSLNARCSLGKESQSAFTREKGESSAWEGAGRSLRPENESLAKDSKNLVSSAGKEGKARIRGGYATPDMLEDRVRRIITFRGHRAGGG